MNVFLFTRSDMRASYVKIGAKLIKRVHENIDTFSKF